MKLQYITVQSTVKPDEIDTTSSMASVYLRRNIHQIQPADQDDQSVSYEYEEAKVPRAEYYEWLAEKNRADLEYMAIIGGVDLNS